MERTDEILAKLASIETRIDYSEDRINKLLRLVSEGNGRPSLQAEVAVIKLSIQNLREKLEKEDVLIKASMEQLSLTLSALKNSTDGDDEDEEIQTINAKGKWTVIAAIVTSAFTLLGMFVDSAPSIIEAIVDTPPPLELNVQDDAGSSYKRDYHV